VNEPTPAAAAPRFDAVPYRSAGSSPFGGTLLLFAGLAIAGLAVGLIASLVAQVLYLVVIFPIVMGLLVGGAGAVLVKRGKVRGPMAIAAASVLAAVVTMLGMHLGVYLKALREIDKQVPGIMAQALSDPMVFVRFVDSRAREGVTIGHGRARGGNGMNLGYAGSYIYWLVEMGFVGFIAFGLMRTASQQPLCELCQGWKKERTVGCLPDGNTDVASGALLEGHLLTLLQHTDPSGPTGLILKAASCPDCGPRSTVDVALVQVSLNAKGQQQWKEISRVSYPGDALAFLDAPKKPA
jgi:hypothetical protein